LRVKFESNLKILDAENLVRFLKLVSKVHKNLEALNILFLLPGILQVNFRQSRVINVIPSSLAFSKISLPGYGVRNDMRDDLSFRANLVV
jgi:hypothetical protein